MSKKQLIKIVVPGDGDYLANEAKGSIWKPVKKVTKEFRRTLASQVDNIQRTFASSFARWNAPAVAVVQLHDQAIAKYKRPKVFFNSLTCPVIGYGRIGELRVSVTPKGLDALKVRLLTSTDQKAVPHLSTIESITPYIPHQGEWDSGEFKSQDFKEGLRLLMFRHRTQAENFALMQAVRSIVGNDSVVELDYSPSICMLKVTPKSKQEVATLQSFIGTQSLCQFPRYTTADVAATQVGEMTDSFFPPPEPGKMYAIAGQFDSGVAKNVAHMNPWVHDRHSWYADTDQNNEHGTFVYALLANGHRLNHRDPRIPDCSVKVVDSIVFDKSNQVDEDDLLNIIDDALEQFPYVRVWNLSLAQPKIVCTHEGFSPLAIALDERAKTKNVLFIVTGGNLPTTARPRKWPQEPGVFYGDEERLCAPGDSIRALCVGGLAHRETPSSIAKSGNPSPIARKGPGGAYLLAPHIAGYSGNCDEKGNCSQSGILSMNAKGELAESMGVSFAISPVTALAATVEEGIRRGGNDSSVLLTKAMILHATFLKHAPLDPSLLNYQGLGAIPSIDEVLFCDQFAPTIVFEANFQDRPQLCKRMFPLPKSAISGKDLKCEILMTLLYDPPLDGQYELEYVRSNVDAKLGARDTQSGKFNTIVEPHLKFFTRGYEKSLVTLGFKWSPLKMYYANFYEQPGNGLAAHPWELHMRVFRREEHRVVESQRAFLFITIRDKSGTALMYDEWVRQMNLQAWQTRDIGVDSRIRLTP